MHWIWEGINSTMIDVIPVISIFIVYSLGKKSYFEEKEYENILKYYIDDCINALISQNEQALQITAYNWGRALKLTKYFRDMGKDTPFSLYMQGFKDLESSLSDTWRNQRLINLIGSDIYYRIQQKLFAYVLNFNSFMNDDLCSYVRIYIEGGKEVITYNQEREKAVIKYQDELRIRFNQMTPFFQFLCELQNLADEFIKQRISVKNLENFKEKEFVKSHLRKMEEIYKSIN